VGIVASWTERFETRRNPPPLLFVWYLMNEDVVSTMASQGTNFEWTCVAGSAAATCHIVAGPTLIARRVPAVLGRVLVMDGVRA
jgi:hypothetical protein